MPFLQGETLSELIKDRSKRRKAGPEPATKRSELEAGLSRNGLSCRLSSNYRCLSSMLLAKWVWIVYLWCA